MLKDHQLINLLPFIYMLNEMVVRNGWLSETDILFQNSIPYSHHKENYSRSHQKGITTVGLRLKKKSAFVAVSGNRQTNWNEVLHTVEINLVQLLNVEIG